jgi:hypothetical protein
MPLSGQISFPVYMTTLPPFGSMGIIIQKETPGQGFMKSSLFLP